MNDEVKKLESMANGLSLIVHRSSLLLLLLLLPGCSIIGAVADKAVGSMPQPAIYVPDKTQSMVVVAENYSNPADSDVETEQLARFIYTTLCDNKVSPQIDPALVIDLRSQDPQKFHAMTVPQIGRAVGAKQVLYVNITQESLSEPIGGEMVHGECTARVKVIDASNGQIRWPPEQAQGFPITVQTPDMKPSGQSGDSDEAIVREALQRDIAEKISRLFYAHEPDDDETDQQQ
jgi:hypothetical protein